MRYVLNILDSLLLGAYVFVAAWPVHVSTMRRARRAEESRRWR